MTTTLDTIATLKALARANDLANARRVALNRIMYELRILHSAEAIKSTVEALMVELATVESNIIGMPTDAETMPKTAAVTAPLAIAGKRPMGELTKEEDAPAYEPIAAKAKAKAKAALAVEGLLGGTWPMQ